MSGQEVQRRAAALMLAAVGGDGFVLAGASAIREHGLTDRPTEDIDLFGGGATTVEEFAAAVDRAEAALQAGGWQVERLRVHPLFARLRVVSPEGEGLDVDFGVNWRADPPVTLALGPVLSERDAVAGKLSAVYSRGEVRDFLDLDAIRASGRYTDADLLALSHQHDGGFDEAMFAAQLSRVLDIPAEAAAQYGIAAEEFAAVQRRVLGWAVSLRDARTPAAQPLAPAAGIDAAASALQARADRLNGQYPISPDTPDDGLRRPAPSL